VVTASGVSHFSRSILEADTHSSLGATVFSAYTLNFQTRLFSALPASFTEAFKSLCASLLSPPDGAEDGHPKRWNASSNSAVWKNFELLGLIDRYESVIASVGYEFIEQHVHETCTGEWAKPVLEDLRVWMSDNVVPWMVHVYARGAGSRACIRSRQLALTDQNPPQLRKPELCFRVWALDSIFTSTRHYATLGMFHFPLSAVKF